VPTTAETLGSFSEAVEEAGRQAQPSRRLTVVTMREDQ
jgi:hypothetical protein